MENSNKNLHFLSKIEKSEGALTLQEILELTEAHFLDYKIETPRLDAEILLTHSLGCERESLFLQSENFFQSAELENFCEFVERRTQGEPVAYIVGEKGFYKDIFKVNPFVLIPRPETELIIDEILKRKKELGQSPRFLDVGTGSGCIGLSLLKFLPQAEGVLLDLSQEALEVCRQNAERLEVQKRCLFELGDFLEKEIRPESFDFVVANPPYIAQDDKNLAEAVKKYEPALALFAREGGYFHLRTWAEKVFKVLKPQGFYAFEIGATQSQKTLKLIETIGYSKLSILKDLSGLERVVLCWKGGARG